MDKEERYWSNLEKVYVHNVYENISSRYDDFLKLSKLSYYESKDGEDWSDSSNKETSSKSKSEDQKLIITTNSNGIKYCQLDNEINCLTLDLNNNNNNLSNINSPGLKLKHKQFKVVQSVHNGGGGSHNHKHSKHNPWPKVKKFILKLERYSLIGRI